jgi:hypothetical protein
MLPGVSSTVLSGHFLEEDLPRLFAGEIGEATRDKACRQIRRWWAVVATTMGPATSLRSIVDRAAVPLAEVLGFEAGEPAILLDQPLCAILLRSPAGATITLIVTAWAADLDALWRAAVRLGSSVHTSWCLCFNATHLRLVDAERTYARRFVEFDLGATLAHPDSFTVLWALLRAEAHVSSPARAPDQALAETACTLINRVVESSAARSVGVCASLKQGVCDSLVELAQGLIAADGGRRSRTPGRGRLSGVLDQSLTIVYRILFLLYAEARGLLPVWHPIYKESYSIETLRSLAEDPQSAAGLWETFQAMSRLAHAGCRAGDLSVTPFNGRLFSPCHAPLADRCNLDEGTMRRAILALSIETGHGPQGRRRIAYRDLGVEQLGSVYETVLDYEPRLLTAAVENCRRAGAAPTQSSARGSSAGLEPGRSQRKATGTFYTPRSITEFLVRSALEPLVASATAERILNLRVLDPSMGSGAFLVAACHHLARAYESALLREGACHPGDIGEAERAGFRRTIAEHCLYGVDANPMAVQLARVSLWLTTLAGDRPLTFLDHTLRTGDSLVGASLDDLARQAPAHPGGRRGQGAPATLPLFEPEEWRGTLREVLPVRGRLSARPSDSIAEVRSKERDLARLNDKDGVLSRWKGAVDLWCACWFWDSSRTLLDRRTFGDLVSTVLGGHGVLPSRVVHPLLAEAADIAARKQFFHWTLEFPEAFFDGNGIPLANPGFDAVVGNPPWEMLRADSSGAAARPAARRLISFARESGIYAVSGRGHLNLYQLFVERALRLTRRGGRVGLVVPWGLASDHGCAALRRVLLEKADTDTMVGFENADGVFPIHRSVRFIALTSTPGARTDGVRCRFGVRDPSDLDRVPENARLATPEHFPVTLTPAFIRRVAGDDLAIPDIRTPADLSIVERITARFPALGSSAGWGAVFSRELNATDDQRFFRPGKGPLTVVDGRHLAPFRVDLGASNRHMTEEDAARRLDPARTYRRARLAYRDVAAASNRLTLIAAMLPAGCLTTHTVFCLRTAMAATDQVFLCGLLNSYVANYLVRQRITTHVSAAVIGRIPAPKPDPIDALFGEGVDLCTALTGAADPEHEPAYAQLQALMAQAYGLSEAEFRLILDSFPLIERGIIAEVLEAFVRLSLRAPRAGCRGESRVP